MIKVRIINNLDAKTTIIDANTTVAAAIESAGFPVKCAGHHWFVNGSVINDLNVTFASLGGDSFDVTNIADQKNA